MPNEPIGCIFILSIKQNEKLSIVKTINNIEITEKEQQFFQAFESSDFFESGIDSILWDYSVNDLLPYKGKVRSGVISSLSQKELISVYQKERGDIAGTYSLSGKGKEVFCDLFPEYKDQLKPSVSW